MNRVTTNLPRGPVAAGRDFAANRASGSQSADFFLIPSSASFSAMAPPWSPAFTALSTYRIFPSSPM